MLNQWFICLEVKSCFCKICKQDGLQKYQTVTEILGLILLDSSAFSSSSISKKIILIKERAVVDYDNFLN